MLELTRFLRLSFQYPSVVLIYSNIQMKAWRFTPISKWRLGGFLRYPNEGLEVYSNIQLKTINVQHLSFTATAAASSGLPPVNKPYCPVSFNIFWKVDSFLSFTEAQKVIRWFLVIGPKKILFTNPSPAYFYSSTGHLCQIQAHKMPTTPFLTPYKDDDQKEEKNKGTWGHGPSIVGKSGNLGTWVKIREAGQN